MFPLYILAHVVLDFTYRERFLVILGDVLREVKLRSFFSCYNLPSSLLNFRASAPF